MVKMVKINGRRIKQLEKGDKLRVVGINATLLVTDEQYERFHNKLRKVYEELKKELPEIRIHDITLSPEDLSYTDWEK